MNKIDELIRDYKEFKDELKELEEDFFEGKICYPEFLERSGEINSIMEYINKEIQEEVLKND